jgi:hypothetical protein
MSYPVLFNAFKWLARGGSASEKAIFPPLRRRDAEN